MQLGCAGVKYVVDVSGSTLAKWHKVQDELSSFLSAYSIPMNAEKRRMGAAVRVVLVPSYREAHKHGGTLPPDCSIPFYAESLPALSAVFIQSGHCKPWRDVIRQKATRQYASHAVSDRLKSATD